MKTTLFVPVLNECEGMKIIMPRIKKEWVDEIFIMDGGSIDGTVELAKQMGYKVSVQKRKGIRHAYTEALAQVKGDVIIPFSPDGNSIPEVIPQLIAKISEGYDMVTASRYLGDAKSDDDGAVTGFGNWMFTKLINILHGGSYTDAMVMYRAWRKQVFYDLDLHKDESYAFEEKMFHTVVGVEPLLSVRAAKRKLKYAEIPADEPPRLGGKAKLQPLRWGASYLYEVLREKFIWK